MERKNALVAGASGIIGRSLVEHLSALEDWRVTGLSRRQPDFKSNAEFIAVDLQGSRRLRTETGWFERHYAHFLCWLRAREESHRRSCSEQSDAG